MGMQLDGPRLPLRACRLDRTQGPAGCGWAQGERAVCASRRPAELAVPRSPQPSRARGSESMMLAPRNESDEPRVSVALELGLPVPSTLRWSVGGESRARRGDQAGRSDHDLLELLKLALPGCSTVDRPGREPRARSRVGCGTQIDQVEQVKARCAASTSASMRSASSLVGEAQVHETPAVRRRAAARNRDSAACSVTTAGTGGRTSETLEGRNREGDVEEISESSLRERTRSALDGEHLGGALDALQVVDHLGEGDALESRPPPWSPDTAHGLGEDCGLHGVRP